jgi:hypothetical protein
MNLLLCLATSAVLMLGATVLGAQSPSVVRTNHQVSFPRQRHDWLLIQAFPTNRQTQGRIVLTNNGSGELSPRRPASSAMLRLKTKPSKPNAAESKLLQPGLYATAPYSCLVLVPGPHPDDRAVVGTGGADADPSMPIIKPDLQFIPRSPAAK